MQCVIPCGVPSQSERIRSEVAPHPRIRRPKSVGVPISNRPPAMPERTHAQAELDTPVVGRERRVSRMVQEAPPRPCECV